MTRPAGRGRADDCLLRLDYMATTMATTVTTLTPRPSDFTDPGTSAEAARAYDAFLSRLGGKDRQAAERHVALCDAESTPEHARLWKRLAAALANLSPAAVQLTGQRAVRFFTADGKYRRQLFALEDARDGTLSVYVGDTLDDAVRAGALHGPVSVDGDTMLYGVPEEPGLSLRVEVLTAAKTTSAPEYYKHLLGWNRSALKVTLPIPASAAQLRAVGVLCRLAAGAK